MYLFFTGFATEIDVRNTCFFEIIYRARSFDDANFISGQPTFFIPMYRQKNKLSVKIIDFVNSFILD